MYVPSLSLILVLCFVGYIGHSMWTMAKLFIAPECRSNIQCIHSFLNSHSKLQMVVYSSASGYRENDLKFVHYFKDFDFHEPFEHDLDVEIPYKTRRNGTLFFHVHVFPNRLTGTQIKWGDVAHTPNRTSILIEMTHYQIPETSKYRLLQENSEKLSYKPVTHLKTEVGVNMLTGVEKLPINGIPGEIAALLRFSRNREFLPIVRHDFLNDRLQNLQEIKRGVTSMPVKLKYSPVSFGMLRYFKIFSHFIQKYPGILKYDQVLTGLVFYTPAFCIDWFIGTSWKVCFEKSVFVRSLFGSQPL